MLCNLQWGETDSETEQAGTWADDSTGYLTDQSTDLDDEATDVGDSRNTSCSRMESQALMQPAQSLAAFLAGHRG